MNFNDYKEQVLSEQNLILPSRYFLYWYRDKWNEARLFVDATGQEKTEAVLRFQSTGKNFSEKQLMEVGYPAPKINLGELFHVPGFGNFKLAPDSNGIVDIYPYHD